MLKLWKSERSIYRINEVVLHVFVLSLSVVFDSATTWTVACQAPFSIRILQARILGWVAMPPSRRSSQPRDQTQVSCIAGRFWATKEACINCQILISARKKNKAEAAVERTKEADGNKGIPEDWADSRCSVHVAFLPLSTVVSHDKPFSYLARNYYVFPLLGIDHLGVNLNYACRLQSNPGRKMKFKLLLP